MMNDDIGIDATDVSELPEHFSFLFDLSVGLFIPSIFSFRFVGQKAF